MPDLLRAIRHALTTLFRDRKVTAVAVLTMGLALGANAAIYGVVTGVLIAPLPYAEPDDLIMIWKAADKGERTWLSLREVIEYGRAATTLAAVEGYTETDASFTDGATPERVAAATVTPGLFSTLGVAPFIGRTFAPEDGAPSASPVILLSHALWQRRFGGEGSVVGRLVRVNGVSRTVVGVLPPAFKLPLDFESERPTECWTPATIVPGEPGAWGNRGYLGVARLAPGATPAAATQELHLIADRWVRAGYLPDQGAGALHRDAVSLAGFVTRDVRRPIGVLLGAVVALLLIACSNVANLQLARGDARLRDLAVRVALGASRADLARELVIEAVVLVMCGGAVGAGLAWALRTWLVSLSPATLPRVSELSFDVGVLALSAAATLMSGLVCGLLPAWRLSRPDVGMLMNEAGRSGTLSAGRHAFRRAMVVTQLAGSVVLLVGAVLLVRGFLAMSRVDLGFDARQVLTADIQLPPDDYPDASAVVRFVRTLTQRLDAQPGVVAAGAVRVLPLARTIGDWSITIDGRPAAPNENPNADYQAVTPGYFEALGLTMARGRPIGPADREATPQVAVINDVMASRYWPGQDALGKRFHMGTDPRPWVTVVGIVGGVRHNAVIEAPRAEMYLAHAQLPEQIRSAPRAMALTIRTAGDPMGAVPRLLETVRGLDPRLPVSRIRPMRQVVEQALAAPRFTASMLLGLAAVALLMAAVGVYGTVALFVAERRREFGIRLALGAAPGRVRRLVLRQGLAMAAAGGGIGVAGAAVLSRSLEGLTYGVTTNDPVALLGVPLALAGVVVMACAGPAWRASRSDPSVVLRP